MRGYRDLIVPSQGSGGGAPTNATYVVISADGTLTDERVLTGTANQITITDNGAGSTVVLSTPQNIHTGASPTFVGLTLSGLTLGSVVFAGTGGLISQDNDRVFWDSAASGLGLRISRSDAGNVFTASKYQTAAAGASYVGRKARGTQAAPRRTAADDVLSGVSAFGAEAVDDATDATFSTGAGQFRFFAATAFTSTDHETYFTLQLCPSASVTQTNVLRINSTGVFKIGNSNALRGTTEGTTHIDIFDGTAPAGTLTNGISLYSTSGELRVMDSAGNATLLSPHDSVTNEWIYDSVMSVTGKRLRVDVERLLRRLDADYGGGYIHESETA